MKLKEYTTENCVSVGRRGMPRINVGSDGRFILSETAHELIGLKVGDKIHLFQDEDKPTAWYLVNNGQEGSGFTLRLIKQADRSMGFNNAALKEKIFESFGPDIPNKKGTIRFLVADQPTEHNNLKLWALLARPS